MQITPQEFNALCKRYELEQERQDRRAGRICAIIANVNRDRKKRQKPFTENDFIPGARERRKKQSPEHMLGIARALNRAYGGSEPKCLQK